MPETAPACRVGPRVLLAGGDGPLAGLDFVVKDMLDVTGSRTGGGNPTWLAQSAPAACSAAAVQALVDAGAACTGKTHTDEFAYSLAGDNAHYGAPVNPAAAGRTCGGSSSGSASAVAAGLAAFGLGTDTGGSVRVPASYCGLVGVRPTHGAVSTDGVLALAPSFDTVGWLARDPRTTERVGQVLLPADSAPPAQRLVLVQQVQDEVSPALARSVATVAQQLSQRSGLPLQVVSVPDLDLERAVSTFMVLQGREAFATHGGWIAAHPDALSSDVEARFLAGRDVTEDQVLAAMAERRRVSAELHELLGSTPTVMVVPSAPGPAPRLDALGPERAAVRRQTLRLTCLAGLPGAPAIGLPLASVDRLPVGVCLVGTPGSDRSLLHLAGRAMRSIDATSAGSA